MNDEVLTPITPHGDEQPAAVSVPEAGNPNAAAFFDVDNTLMHGASLYWLARGMASRGFFTTRDVLAFAWKQARFRVRGTEHDGHINDIKQCALSFVAGHQVDELTSLSEEIFESAIEERIFTGTRRLVQAHRMAGHRVWLVTAAPVELAGVIADRLGLTGALGTIAESHDGVYTGRLVGDILHGPAKAVAITALADELDLDLSACTAYSDSSNDLPMLEACGHAVAVNPDANLRRLARQREWRIHDFRTGRKAVKVAVPTAVAAGSLAGALAGGLAWRGRWRTRRADG